MKMLLSPSLILCLLVGAQCSFASDIVGQYYISPEQTANGVEGLWLIQEDGTFQIRSVNQGKQDIIVGTYSVNDGMANFSEGEYAATCPNVARAASGIMVTQYFRSPTELDFVAPDMAFGVRVATKAEVDRILSLPVCGK